MSKTFATFNANALGPGLALDLGNLVVTTNQNGIDADRAVFSTIPKGVGHGYIEGYFYSTSQGNLAGLCALGVAEVTSSLTAKVGSESTSWAFWPDTGGIYNGGAVLDSGSSQAISERLCIGVYLSLDDLTVAWYVEGSQVGSATLPANKFWVLAVSVGATAAGAGDLSAFVNFGQRAFENQPSQIV